MAYRFLFYKVGILSIKRTINRKKLMKAEAYSKTKAISRCYFYEDESGSIVTIVKKSYVKARMFPNIHRNFFFSEQNDGSHAFEEGTGSWAQNSPRYNRNAVTPSAGKFPMHNNAHVQFESPKVPVIFVLGK